MELTLAEWVELIWFMRTSEQFPTDYTREQLVSYITTMRGHQS